MESFRAALLLLIGFTISTANGHGISTSGGEPETRHVKMERRTNANTGSGPTKPLETTVVATSFETKQSNDVMFKRAASTTAANDINVSADAKSSQGLSLNDVAAGLNGNQINSVSENLAAVNNVETVASAETDMQGSNTIQAMVTAANVAMTTTQQSTVSDNSTASTTQSGTTEKALTSTEATMQDTQQNVTMTTTVAAGVNNVSSTTSMTSSSTVSTTPDSTSTPTSTSTPSRKVVKTTKISPYCPPTRAGPGGLLCLVQLRLQCSSDADCFAPRVCCPGTCGNTCRRVSFRKSRTLVAMT